MAPQRNAAALTRGVKAQAVTPAPIMAIATRCTSPKSPDRVPQGI
jgi:hypothetical protein